MDISKVRKIIPEETKEMTDEEVQKMEEAVSVLSDICLDMFYAHKAKLTEEIIEKIIKKHKVGREEAINLFFTEYNFVKDISEI